MTDDLKKILRSIKNTGGVSKLGAGWTRSRINATMTELINRGFLDSNGNVTEAGKVFLNQSN